MESICRELRESKPLMEVVITGYCMDCEEQRPMDKEGRCYICGSRAVDRTLRPSDNVQQIHKDRRFEYRAAIVQVERLLLRASSDERDELKRWLTWARAKEQELRDK